MKYNTILLCYINFGLFFHLWHSPYPYRIPAGKIAKNTHWRSVFWFNRHSKYDTVLSKIHSSRQLFQQFCRPFTSIQSVKNLYQSIRDTNNNNNNNIESKEREREKKRCFHCVKGFTIFP